MQVIETLMLPSPRVADHKVLRPILADKYYKVFLILEGFHPIPWRKEYYTERPGKMLDRPCLVSTPGS